MRKLWVSVLCWFLPRHRWRQNLRQRWASRPQPQTPQPNITVEDQGLNNRVCFEPAARSAVLRATVRIYGHNNEIVISQDQSHIKELIIVLFGDHHKVRLGNHLLVSQSLEIVIGVPYDDPKASHCRVTIGDDNYIESAKLELSDHASARIGNGCLLAGNIHFELTDYHAIFQAGTAQLLNRGRFIELGDRVWVGHDVTFLKNSRVADGCVVGCHSVVAGSFSETDAMIVGNSARVVKHGIRWDHRSVNTCLDHPDTSSTERHQAIG